VESQASGAPGYGVHYGYDVQGLGNKIVYDSKTGYGTFTTDPKIGTRIPEQKRVCLDDKCAR
jgi:hypothetical protein